MVVAKRQRREKTHNKGLRRTGVRISGETNSPPGYIGLAHGKEGKNIYI